MCNQSSTLIHSYKISQTGGLAQLARAPALHAGGQRFESVILHSGKEEGTEKKKLSEKSNSYSSFFILNSSFPNDL